MINIPKGTKDVLPSQSYKWQYIEDEIRKVCKQFNILEIRTPTFEHTELFLRSIGDETDVVSKEMYTFEDKGHRSITLKPEGTASTVRSYIENNLEAMSLPLKMFYLTPVFRYEAPQAGRLREHHQFGVEMYGSQSPYADAEVINAAYTLLTRLGVKNLALNINSIGCPECRVKFNAALKEYLSQHIEEMCDDCKRRFATNPLRIIDCKKDNCKKVVANAPKILDYICDDCRNHFEALQSILKAENIPFTVNSSIVRGLDYYTKTVFEFVTTSLGAQGTVCGGGRYDNLVSSMGGKFTPCVGFGMGIERLIMLLEANGKEFPHESLDYYIACQSEECREVCRKVVSKLRQDGYSAETDFMSRSVKAQFKYADKINAKYTVVIGESELQSGKAQIKRMSDGEKQEKSLDDLSWTL
ncbi:MAG: histidine--tRNA ligase [Clostridiales bacterium]|nr:histidine--tRNA ligase [Clostridiales bacterium]